MWRNRPLYMMSTPHRGDAVEERVEKNGRKSQAPNANSLGAESSGRALHCRFTLYTPPINHMKIASRGKLFRPV